MFDVLFLTAKVIQILYWDKKRFFKKKRERLTLSSPRWWGQWVGNTTATKVLSKNEIWQTSSLFINLSLFSYSVISDSLQPYGLQHTSFPCWSLSPGVCSNSCPLSGWYHPTISTKLGEVMPLLFLPSIFHSIRVFFQWVGSLHHVAKLTGASASASVLPMNIQG